MAMLFKIIFVWSCIDILSDANRAFTVAVQLMEKPLDPTKLSPVEAKLVTVIAGKQTKRWREKRKERKKGNGEIERERDGERKREKGEKRWREREGKVKRRR